MDISGSDDTDIVLVSSEGSEFHLALRVVEEEDRCGYIRGLLRSGMRECDQRRVQLPVISDRNLQTAVSFLRGEEITLDGDTVTEILETATYLQIPDLVEKCGHFLLQNLDVETVVDTLNTVEHFSMRDLADKARDYLYRNVPQFSDTSDFLSMDFDDVIRLLASRDLEVREIDVLKAAIKWLRENRNEKSVDRLGQLLNVVRFPLLTAEELIEARTLVEDFLPLNQDLKENFEEASRFHEDPYLIHEKISISMLSRRTVTSLIALGGFTGKEHSTNRFQQWSLDELDSSFSSEQSVDFRSGKSGKLPTTLCEHSACVVDGFLYVAGGQTRYCQDGRYTSNAVHRYDPRFSTWMQVRPMQTPRSLFYLGVLDGHVYAVAGWKAPNSVSRSVERYSPRENTWQYVASLDMGLHEHAGCSTSSQLYVTGGYKGPARGHLDRAWRYDPKFNQWQTLPPMLHARSYHAMVAVDEERLLVLGGVNALAGDVFEDVQACELYSMSSKQWTVVSYVPRPASCMGYFQRGHRVFLLGGHSFSDHSDHTTVQVLDVTDLTWTSLPMASNRILHFPVVVMNLPSLLAKTFQR